MGLKPNNVNIGLSGVVNLNKNNLSMGVLSSFTQSSIDPSAIMWGINLMAILTIQIANSGNVF